MCSTRKGGTVETEYAVIIGAADVAWLRAEVRAIADVYGDTSKQSWDDGDEMAVAVADRIAALLGERPIVRP